MKGELFKVCLHAARGDEFVEKGNSDAGERRNVCGKN